MASNFARTTQEKGHTDEHPSTGYAAHASGMLAWERVRVGYPAGRESRGREGWVRAPYQRIHLSEAIERGQLEQREGLAELGLRDAVVAVKIKRLEDVCDSLHPRSHRTTDLPHSMPNGVDGLVGGRALQDLPAGARPRLGLKRSSILCWRHGVSAAAGLGVGGAAATSNGTAARGSLELGSRSRMRIGFVAPTPIIL